MDTEAELSRIAAKIDDLCASAPKPYYISALGIALGSDLQTLKILTGDSLRNFIESRFSGKYQIERLGAHQNVLAILPAGTGLGQDEVSVPVGPLRDAKGREKYHYRLWAAFSVPSQDGVRYFNTETLTFVDLPREEGQPEGTLKIGHEFIAPADSPCRDDLIWESVTKWLKENNLERDRFFAQPKQVLKTVRATAPGGRSVLEAVLQSLSPHQLQATQLSLDVVAALLRARQG